jgi:hypothetical protein
MTSGPGRPQAAIRVETDDVVVDRVQGRRGMTFLVKVGAERQSGRLPI